jgi:ABC-type transporter Mla maintaining outer membrane lipid asymmetry permease subunit MlaE
MLKPAASSRSVSRTSVHRTRILAPVTTDVAIFAGGGSAATAVIPPPAI